MQRAQLPALSKSRFLGLGCVMRLFSPLGYLKQGVNLATFKKLFFGVFCLPLSFKGGQPPHVRVWIFLFPTLAVQLVAVSAESAENVKYNPQNEGLF